MNWDAIGSAGEIISAIAVVASLVYLASQIRNQNRIALRDSRNIILDRWSIIGAAQFESADVAALMNKLRSYSAILTDEERVRVTSLAQMYLSVIGAINSAEEAGTLAGKILERNLDIMSINIGEYPGVYPYIAEILKQVDVDKGTTSAFDRIIEDISKAKSASGT